MKIKSKLFAGENKDYLIKMHYSLRTYITIFCYVFAIYIFLFSGYMILFKLK